MSLRIGMLCHDSVGGSARIGLELSVALARRGHELHLFARRPPLGITEYPEGMRLHTLRPTREEEHLTPRLYVDWPPGEIDAMVRMVTTVARSERLDVLHCHYAVPFAEIVERAGRRLRASAPALVATLHGTDVTLLAGDLPAHELLAATLGRLDAVTTVSSSHAALAVRTLQLEEEPVIIPNFVDLHRFRRAPRRRPSRARPRVVHISNFRPVKQPQAMARVFREARRQVEAELWLVGDGEGMPAVLALLEGSGLRNHVRTFGLRVDVERILPQADVLLVTSRTESFCMAALEAAACGVPAVAPDVGGLPETVLDGQTGTLYEPGDEAGAAAALARLLGDRDLRTWMGEAAAWHARQLSAAAVVPRYAELYRDVLVGRREAREAEATPAA